MREEKTPLPKEQVANKTFAFSSSVSTEYCRIIRDSIEEIKADTDLRIIRRKAFICNLVAISAIETFFNGYFQLLAEQREEFEALRLEFYQDFNSYSFGISKQLRKWPKLFFGKDYDETDPAVLAFRALVNSRNRFTHFKSDYSTIAVGEGVTISGLADITAFESLALSDAETALTTVVEIVEYILRADGVPEKKLPWGVARWTGIHPIERGYPLE